MSKRKLYVLIGVAALIVLTIVAWHPFFGDKVTASLLSVSPDGMYRCTVTERASTGQCRTEIVLDERKNLTSSSGKDLWKEVRRKEVLNESACRSNYSVNWEYDSKHRTTGLTVFGDFGSPPFAGEVLMTEPISPGP